MLREALLRGMLGKKRFKKAEKQSWQQPRHQERQEAGSSEDQERGLKGGQTQQVTDQDVRPGERAQSHLRRTIPEVGVALWIGLLLAPTKCGMMSSEIIAAYAIAVADISPAVRL